MSHPLEPWLWPRSRLPEALETLAQKSGLTARKPKINLAPPGETQPLSTWMHIAAGCLSLESEAVTTSYAELEGFLLGAGPAVLCYPDDSGQTFLVLLGRRGGKVKLLDPDLNALTVRPADLITGLSSERLESVSREVDSLLESASVALSRRPRVRSTLLAERLASFPLGPAWLLRLHPGAPIWQQVRHQGLMKWIAGFFGAQILLTLIMMVSWWVLGTAAFGGQSDRDWFVLWALLLSTELPLDWLVVWAQGRFSIALGGIIKQRLLVGALAVDPQDIRSQGMGQLLGRVMESSALESLALSAGFSGVVALIGLGSAAWVLSMGPYGGLRLALGLFWALLTLWLAFLQYRKFDRWTELRCTLTNDLVERMVGHRTRLAQEHTRRFHDGEDELLCSYLVHSEQMDRTTLRVNAYLTRGWMIVGLAGIIPQVLSGQGGASAIAVALGGILLAFQAFGSLTRSLQALTSALVAWKQIGPLAQRAAEQLPSVPAEPALLFGQTQRETTSADALLQGCDLTFRYRPQSAPVLNGCDLAIHQGDRVLLQGPSGGGKTTLSNLLVGLCQPERGLLLFKGLDPQTLGSEGWRQRVVAAPQFHENHVLTGTFAFNLLMGRCWPPGPADIDLASAVCQELGLGSLIERMPSGLLQMVGETGWRLSHGERSRLFIARAILQESQLIVLDESFGALDPETLRQCVECVLRRAPTLVVIAHP